MVTKKSIVKIVSLGYFNEGKVGRLCLIKATVSYSLLTQHHTLWTNINESCFPPITVQ